jgi:hypothetical protein
MKIRIRHGGRGNEGSTHHVDILDLREKLEEQGYRLARVERGERNSGIPAINLNLLRPPPDGTELQLPATLHLAPYDHPRDKVNVKATLVGLRQQLHGLFGVNKRVELYVRVFIPNYDYEDDRQHRDELETIAHDLRPRDRVEQQILARRRAIAFRNEQLSRFGHQCAVSGCALVDVLEAAHIRKYCCEADNARTNGILLRADLHILFDVNLLAIHPTTHRISVHEKVRESQYRQFDGLRVRLPDGGFDEAAIRLRWKTYRA